MLSVLLYKSVMVNSFMQSKTSTNKKQFGDSKCKKNHIGRQCEDFKCHPLLFDTWEENEVQNADTGNLQVEDVCIGEEVMEEKHEEKYLGDVISKDGRNLKNIQARINKGKGIVKKILNILEGIPFGKMYFQVAVLLRNSLLVSSLLCNSEAWFNLTDSELNLLETVDLILLRSIMKAPKSTPKETLFLELGLQPLRELIRQRRLNFLHYILTQGADSMIFKVFNKQSQNRQKKDWVTTVLKDLELVGLNVTFADIQAMNKTKWKNIVKLHIREKSLQYLQEIKQKHSKVKELKHVKLEMQKYLLPNKYESSKEDIQSIFKIRSRVLDLKMNLKGIYDTYECEVCLKEEESQKHIYECTEIWKIREINHENIPKYENILNGDVLEMIEVAKIIQANMKIQEKAKDKD